MHKSFDSDITYCFSVENSNGQFKKSNTMLSMSLEDIINEVKCHVDGQKLLGSQEVLMYMKEISKIKISSHKSKFQVEKLESILKTIYKKNKIFEESMCKSKEFNGVITDSIIDCGVSQDLKMLAKHKNYLSPMRSLFANKCNFPRRQFNENSSTDPNFLNLDISKMIRANSKSITSNYSDLPNMLTNQNFKSAFSIDNVNKNYVTFHSTSKCSSLFLNQDLNQYHQSTTSNISCDLFSTQDIQPLTEIGNKFESTNMNSSEQLPSQIRIESNSSPNMNSSEQLPSQIRMESNSSPKNNSEVFVESMSIDDFQSQSSEQISSLPRNSSKKIVNSSCDVMDMDSRSSEIESVFKKPFVVSKRISASDSSIAKSSNVSLKEKSLDDNCEDLCKLTNKFLKIGDDCCDEISLVKNIAHPRNKINYQEVVKLGSFSTKHYNKKVNTIMYNISTNSATWEEFSNDINEMSCLHEKISDLSIEILKSINDPENVPDDKYYDDLEKKLADCLIPEDDAKLDLKDLVLSNTLQINQISKNLKSQLLMEYIITSSKSNIDIDVDIEDNSIYGWKKI